MVSFFAKVKIFRFWPKTMDYNKAFWPKSRSFFVVLLLQNGRCYEAEICAILLLLRCPFRWNPFLPKSKFSDFGQKPWTIIRRFSRNRDHSLWSFYLSLEGAMKLKLPPFCSSLFMYIFTLSPSQSLWQRVCSSTYYDILWRAIFNSHPPISFQYGEYQDGFTRAFPGYLPPDEVCNALDNTDPRLQPVSACDSQVTVM